MRGCIRGELRRGCRLLGTSASTAARGAAAPPRDSMHWGSAVTHRRPPIFYAVASHASARPHGRASCVCTSVRSRPMRPCHARRVSVRSRSMRPCPGTSRPTCPHSRAFAPTLTRQFRIPSPTLRHIARTTFYLRRSSSHRQHHLTCLVSPYFSAIGNRFPYFQQYFIVAIFITFQTVMNLQIFGEILPLASIYTLSKAPKSLFRSFLSHPARTTVKLADFFVESITVTSWTSLFCPVFDSRTLVSASPPHL